jgi:hypothetical protein
VLNTNTTQFPNTNTNTTHCVVFVFVFKHCVFPVLDGYMKSRKKFIKILKRFLTRNAAPSQRNESPKAATSRNSGKSICSAEKLSHLKEV